MKSHKRHDSGSTGEEGSDKDSSQSAFDQKLSFRHNLVIDRQCVVNHS